MSSPQMVTVTGTFPGKSGTIRLSRDVWLRSSTDDTIIAPERYTATLDGTGHFSLTVPATNSSGFTPQGFTYGLRVSLAGVPPYAYDTSIPYSATPYELADLLPALTPSQGASYAPLVHSHGAVDLSGYALVGHTHAAVDLSAYATKVYADGVGTAVQFTANAAYDKSVAAEAAVASKLDANAATFDALLGSANPTDHALNGWSFDPALVQGGTVLPTAGTLYVARLRVLRSTINNILLHFPAGGSGLVAGQCFAALFNDAGTTRLGTSADQAASWASGGLKTIALTAPVTGLTPYTFVRAAWWFNGTTGPSVSRAVNSATAIVNAGIASAFRYATANTGLTTTAPNTIGAMTGGPTAWWVGLS